MVSIQYGIVILGRNVITECFRAVVSSVDIHSLCIVLTLRGFGIVINPSCEIIVTNTEKVFNLIFAHKSVQHVLRGTVLEISIQTACIIHKGQYAAKFLLKGSTETGSFQQFVHSIVKTGIGHTNTFPDKIVQVFFQIFFGKTVFYVIPKVFKKILPIDST